MSFNKGCTECENLRNDLAEAIRAYHRVVNQYELAILNCDRGIIEKLDAKRREVAATRDAIRDALRGHVEACHETAGAEKQHLTGSP